MKEPELPVLGTGATAEKVDSPILPSPTRQWRPRANVRSAAKKTARIPIRLFQSLTSGVVKGSKKLVRVNKRSNRNRRSRGGGSRRRRQMRNNASILDDSISRNESTPLLDSADKNLSTHSANFSASTVDIYERRRIDSGTRMHDAQARVLETAEVILRKALILIGSFLLGAYQPIEFLTPSLIINMGSFLGVAWGTCALIQLISWFDLIKSDSDSDDHEEGDEEHAHSVGTEDGAESLDRVEDNASYDGDMEPVLQLKRPMRRFRRGIEMRPNRVFTLRRKKNMETLKQSFDSMDFDQDDKYNADNEDDEDDKSGDDENQQDLQPSSHDNMVGLKSQPPQHHPELEDLFLIDLLGGDRLPASGEPTAIDNDLMTGEMLFMSRTSDADLKTEPDQTKGTALHDSRANYFRNKQRRFELQFQVKFKRVPPAQLYFHCQLKEPIKLGVIQRCVSVVNVGDPSATFIISNFNLTNRVLSFELSLNLSDEYFRAFVGATLNFIEKKNKGSFVYNVPGKEPKPGEVAEGRYEHPHITFAVEQAFDRIARTKEGEQAPLIGSEISEDEESIKRRKNFEPIEYNTRDTFTFALWSAYGDFTKWKCVNLPAIRPFSFKSIIQDQNFSMHVYYLEGTNGDSRHLNCYQRRIASFELNHAKYCKVSDARKTWLQKYSAQEEDSMIRETLPDQNDQVVFSENEDLDGVQGDIMSYSDSSRSNGEDSDDDDDEQTRALEELGEGMYLKSGDSIVLREESNGVNEIDSSLTNGGGYATLQMETTGTIVLEKFRPKPRRKNNIENQEIHKSSLIRDGDTVMVKLIDTLEPISYLSVHKGWWLKWVRKFPKSTGLFTIHTNAIEDIIGSSVTSPHLSMETQSSYLRFGGTFNLKSKGSGLEVGVRVSNSTKFGGRVLALYKNGSRYLTELDQDVLDKTNAISRRQMMTPLKLRVDLPITAEPNANENPPLKPWVSPRSRPLTALEEPIEDFHIDTPAWIETLHRNKRRVCRVYAIRMTRQKVDSTYAPVADFKHSTSDEEKPFSSLRLRTGKDITPLLRVGLTSSNPHRTQNCDSPVQNKRSYDQERNCSEFEVDRAEMQKTPTYDLSNADKTLLTIKNANLEIQKKSFESSNSDFSNESDDGYSFSDNSGNNSDDDDQAIEPMTRSPHAGGDTRKKKKWIRSTTHGITKVAKGMKTGTMKSGTLIGKAVTHTIKGHRRGYYLKDKPKQTRGKEKSRDHHVAVNKALKKMQSPVRQYTKRTKLQISGSIIAGQLKPPDQSCRTVSDILSTVSSSPSIEAKMLLSAHLALPSDLDSSFLSGGTLELGVNVDTTGKGDPVGEFVVGRALWETMWREEVCVVHGCCIDFYSPLSSKANFGIPFYDIQRVRRVDDDGYRNPLAEHPILVVETAWQCHYLAFSSEDIRTDFFNILNASIFSSGKESFQQDELNAHMWQGVQFSADSSGESAKWADVGSSKKKKRRIILNSRRMPFDCEAFDLDKNDKDAAEKEMCYFVQNLLQKALSITDENLVSNPKNFIQFLDDTSRLRQLPLREINNNGIGAFCICINIYHCLLQHALLLSKTGPPTKKNVVNFMRTHCYEIGGDVFSLAELESCVIRGNMPKPYYPKPPYVHAHKTSRGHYAYALDYIDPRVIFVLNTGIMSHPSEVPVLKPENLEEQLNFVSRLFLKSHIKVDTNRKIVTLPKICDIYRNDFDGGPRTCVEYCLQFLDENSRSKLIEMLETDPSSLTYRYEHSCDKFYATLKPMGS